MRRELLVPKLGLTMTEGVLVEWAVQPGEPFKAGQLLFVIESEKAASEIGAEADGVLLEITAQAGETLPCGTVIGFWDDAQPEQAQPSDASVAALRIPVTPLARRLAAERNVSLASVVGSGPRGRIRARDVLEMAQRDAQALPIEEVAMTAPAGQVGTLRAPTSLERTAALRLTTAKRDVPHFYLSVEAEMSAVMSLRAQVNAARPDKKLTLNHFLLAAVGQALQAMPEVNCVWTDEGILALGGSDVGMAVDTDKGLFVPVLRDVGRQSLGAIADHASDMIARAQAGRLSSADMCGGAITISNAGMHDVTYMASIINPGQSMILGVGCIRGVFRPDEAGQPALRQEMGMVLSADHRVMNGVTALRFLQRVVQNLSRPVGLLVS